jgi:hypothetical protein
LPERLFGIGEAVVHELKDNAPEVPRREGLTPATTLAYTALSASVLSCRLCGELFSIVQTYSFSSSLNLQNNRTTMPEARFLFALLRERFCPMVIRRSHRHSPQNRF